MQGLVLGGLPLPSGAAEPPYQTPVRKGKAGEEGDSSGGERHKRKGSGRGVLGHTRTHTRAHTEAGRNLWTCCASGGCGETGELFLVL